MKKEWEVSESMSFTVHNGANSAQPFPVLLQGAPSFLRGGKHNCNTLKKSECRQESRWCYHDWGTCFGRKLTNKKTDFEKKQILGSRETEKASTKRRTHPTGWRDIIWGKYLKDTHLEKGVNITNMWGDEHNSKNANVIPSGQMTS